MCYSILIYISYPKLFLKILKHLGKFSTFLNQSWFECYGDIKLVLLYLHGLISTCMYTSVVARAGQNLRHWQNSRKCKLYVEQCNRRIDEGIFVPIEIFLFVAVLPVYSCINKGHSTQCLNCSIKRPLNTCKLIQNIVIKICIRSNSVWNFLY